MAANDAQVAESSSVAHDEFVEHIATLSATHAAEAQGEIKNAIWERYGTSGATFISDTANISSTSRSLGVCHFS